MGTTTLAEARAVNASRTSGKLFFTALQSLFFSLALVRLQFARVFFINILFIIRISPVNSFN